jgi:hypothetical protein
VQRQIASIGDGILAELDPDVRADVLAVLGHVWYSTLVSWANGRRDFASVMTELERATRVLVTPYEREAKRGRKARRGRQDGKVRAP